MSEYIDREGLLATFDEAYVTDFFGLNEYSEETFQTLRFIVRTIPEADVKENVKSEWELIKYPSVEIYRCPCCGYRTFTKYWNFCPSCGADMRGK